LASIRWSLQNVEGLIQELSLGSFVDYKQIKFPGVEDLLAGTSG
jgi:hypothetical protein